MKIAAIDIGSNAVRLLVTEVVVPKGEEPQFNKLNLFRIPIRLGMDVFEMGYISEEKCYMLIQTIKAFRHLINVYQVDHFRACATSAMREAKNANYLRERVKKDTGVDIEIISGEEEANLVFESGIAEHMSSDNDYMYIDVGGGSTEISIFSMGKMIFKKSFEIGTIRILKGTVEEEEWEVMKQSIKLNTKQLKSLIAIGSGGNINKIFSMSKKKEGKPLSIELLRDYYKELSSVCVEDRISLYALKADRADVIVPALLIYINAMRWADANEISVPKIGLVDGLVKHQWFELASIVSVNN